MPRGNPENMKPPRTKEEARERGRRGGIASGKARREKRDLQTMAKAILSMPIKPGDIEDIDFLQDVQKTDENGKKVAKNLSVGQAALIQQAQKAIKGDANALAFLRDTAGEKPVEKVEVSGDIAQASNEIDELVKKVKKKPKKQKDGDK